MVVIDDFSTGNLANVERHLGNPRFRLIREKVSECGNLSALAAAAEEIYHLAAVVGVDLVIKSCIKTIEVNLAETQAILSAAAAHGDRGCCLLGAHRGRRARMLATTNATSSVSASAYHCTA